MSENKCLCIRLLIGTGDGRVMQKWGWGGGGEHGSGEVRKNMKRR